MYDLKKILFALLLTLSTAFVYAQDEPKEEAPQEESVHKKLKDAYEAYEAREYTEAIERFKDAFSKANGRKQKADITFKIADSYNHIRDGKNANNYYKRAFKMGYGDEALFQQGEMLRFLGEYEDALDIYREYKELNPSDKRADVGIESCNKAIEWQSSPTRYEVLNLGDINSKQHDFALAYSAKINRYDELMFGSMREGSTGKYEDGWTGQAFSDIYVVSAERKTKKKKKKKKGKKSAQSEEELAWSTPLPLDEVINTPDHEGSLTFDSRRKTMYFTRCVFMKRAHMGCSIMVTKRQGQSWQAPEMVVLTADSSESVGHPSLSPDDEVLYFSGEIQGSKGKDIFMTTYNRREKRWNTPKNLGPKVNTDGDEYYPFAHADGYLYFSSNGRGGMGGFDIFRVKLDETGMPVEEAENLMYPINTNYDEMSIIFEAEAAEKGYLTSDRKGGRGGYDLYSVYLVPKQFTLDGIVTSLKNGKPVQGATVRLTGVDGTSVTAMTDSEGKYFFEKENFVEGETYKVAFEKEKFLNNTGDVTTIGIPISAFEYVEDEKYYLHPLKLDKVIDPIEIPIVLPNVLFETAKWDLRPEAQVSLDTVVQILNDNPNIVIALRSHTDYKDTEERNKILSQHRADTCVKYLISKGIDPRRLEADGMGESEPFVIPENFKGYRNELFAAGTKLTEKWIKRQSGEVPDAANQLNRRTDFKVLRDDFVPDAPVVVPGETPTSKEPTGPVKGEFYTVSKPMSWGRVAKDAGIKLKVLKKLNGGLRGIRPFPGMVLKVTPNGDYTEFDANHTMVQRNEDYKKIAKRLDMDKGDLEDLNPDIKSKDLQPGMYIKIK